MTEDQAAELRRQLELAAAGRLEELLPHMQEIIGEIREGKVPAHAAIYEARREVSRIVVMLGAGVVPNKSGHDWGVSASPFVIPDGSVAARCKAHDERGQQCVHWNFDGHGDIHRFAAIVKG